MNKQTKPEAQRDNNNYKKKKSNPSQAAHTYDFSYLGG
jgi:hypothetical protein